MIHLLPTVASAWVTRGRVGILYISASAASPINRPSQTHPPRQPRHLHTSSQRHMGPGCLECHKRSRCWRIIYRMLRRILRGGDPSLSLAKVSQTKIHFLENTLARLRKLSKSRFPLSKPDCNAFVPSEPLYAISPIPRVILRSFSHRPDGRPPLGPGQD